MKRPLTAFKLSAAASNQAIFEKNLDCDAKRLGKRIDVVDADIAFSRFDLGNIGLVKPCNMGKLFLRDAAFSPKSAQIAGENLSS